MRMLLLGGVACGVATSGCIGVSQPRARFGSTTAPEDRPVGSEVVLARAGVKACAANFTRPADDGDLDDFEDRNSQLTRLSGRDGYWWTKKDPAGSTLQPKNLKPVEGGAGGSSRALHVWGQTASGDSAWGAGVGVNLTTHGAYDGERYAGIAFKAKVGENSTRRFRFKIGDVNTHKDGAICTSCWNHFGKDFEFTTEWKEYKATFAAAKQEPYWGKPRPPALLPGQLFSVDWSIGTGQTFDLWIDDVYFLDCL